MTIALHFMTSHFEFSESLILFAQLRPVSKKVLYDTRAELNMRTFVYCRVSTEEQTTEEQIEAIRAQGYEVKPFWSLGR